jgi:hypothetical protein
MNWRLQRLWGYIGVDFEFQDYGLLMAHQLYAIGSSDLVYIPASQQNKYSDALFIHETEILKVCSLVIQMYTSVCIFKKYIFLCVI